jgi:hypothetical protein
MNVRNITKIGTNVETFHDNVNQSKLDIYSSSQCTATIRKDYLPNWTCRHLPRCCITGMQLHHMCTKWLPLANVSGSTIHKNCTIFRAKTKNSFNVVRITDDTAWDGYLKMVWTIKEANNYVTISAARSHFKNSSMRLTCWRENGNALSWSCYALAYETPCSYLHVEDRASWAGAYSAFFKTHFLIWPELCVPHSR